MILILCTPKEEVHTTLRKEVQLLVKTTDDVIYNILPYAKLDIENIIVTKSYVDSFGIHNVVNALNLFKNVKGHIRVIYISYIETKDIFLNELSSYLEVRPLNCELKDLTLEILNKALKKNFILKDTPTNTNITGQIRTLINKYQELHSSNRALFLDSHHNEIADILNYTLTLVNDNEIINREISKLEGQASMYKAQYNKLLNTSISLSKENSKLKSLITQWQNTYNNLTDEIVNINTHYNLRTYTTNNGNAIVLYFKELEEIHFMKYFDYLYNLFTGSGLYCKSLIIDERNHIDYSDFGYIRVPDNIALKDLVSITKLLRNSDCKDLLSLLVSENFKCDIILVYDKSRHSNPLIENAYIFFLGNYNTYNIGYINEMNFISQYEGKWQDIGSVLIPIKEQHSQTNFNLVSNNLPLTKYLKSISDDNVKITEYEDLLLNLEVDKFEVE